MTRVETRIEICKDVLKQLRYLNVSTGNYLEIGYIKRELESAKELLCKNKKRCCVCALGSLFFSYVNKFNKIKPNDVGRYCGWESKWLVNVNEILSKLERYFSQKQLAIIETAFEGNSYGIAARSLSCLDKNYHKCIDFYYRYSHPKTRLRAILNNIIENNGVFKP